MIGFAFRLITSRAGLIGLAVIAIMFAAFIAVKWHSRQIDTLSAEASASGMAAERAIWARLVADSKAQRDIERRRAASAIADLGERAAVAEQKLEGLIHANDQLLADIAGRDGFVDWVFDPDIVRALNRLEYPAAVSAGTD